MTERKRPIIRDEEEKGMSKQEERGDKETH